jgi:osmotically inducible protein OsmC
MSKLAGSSIEFSGFESIEKDERSNIVQRKASAVWQGGLKDGRGSISTDSGVLKQTQYSFSTRFENGIGTNPEELLAAAHAGCFTMALSAQLGNAGMTATRLEITATITLDKLADGFAVTKSHLDLIAQIPGADKAKFDAAVKAAETGCPVSKLFKAEISVNARLES